MTNFAVSALMIGLNAGRVVIEYQSSDKFEKSVCPGWHIEICAMQNGLWR
jgi:hypothetical protein